MHNSSSISLCVSYSFRNEEKLVAPLVYFSFQRVATSGIRNSGSESNLTFSLLCDLCLLVKIFA